MVLSMTGYGRGRADGPGFSVSATIKATNHRFFDLQLRLPVELEACEGLIRRLVKEQVRRGHVEVTLAMERLTAPALEVDEALLESYVTACQKLRREYGFSAQPDPVNLLRIPGIVKAPEGKADEWDGLDRAVEQAASEALAQLQQMRRTEGVALTADLRGRLQTLRTLADQVMERSARTPDLYRRRLEGRLHALIGNFEIEPTRLSQEVAYLASHSDITEELTRFQSHLDQAFELMEQSSEVGKKLDFLLQEMNREANTLLSKTTDVPEVGVEIARQAIAMKAEIEKLREQAQNVE
jgi:uncharacterized protein (TIGR00255 family)